MNKGVNNLIAENVMGWTFFKDPDNFKPGSWYYKEKLRAEAFWNPSENTAHAWEVVGKMNELGWSCTLYSNPIPNQSGVVFHRGTSMFSYLKVGIPLPIAICIGALKAHDITLADLEEFRARC